MKETERRGKRQTERLNNWKLVPELVEPQYVASDWTMIRLATIWVLFAIRPGNTRVLPASDTCTSSCTLTQHLSISASSCLSLCLILSPAPALHLSFSPSPISYLCRNNITAGVRGFAYECCRGLFLGQSEWTNLGLHAVLPHHLWL